MHLCGLWAQYWGHNGCERGVLGPALCQGAGWAFPGPCPQVRVLELENQLQKERQKLGELRKKHYELAGVAEGWEEDGEWCQPCSSWAAAPGKGGAGWRSPACHAWQ